MVDIVAQFDEGHVTSKKMDLRGQPSTFKLDRDPNNPRIAIIRTSDRIAFKHCRRKWGWSSHLRHNLGPRESISQLWYGTGFHFALEDFHGYNRFGHPKAAFDAYVRVYKDHLPHKLPEKWQELVELGHGMLDYYIVWLQQRHTNILRTFWLDGVPQVEVNFRFRIPGDWSHYGYDEVYYSGTIDRVCIDEYGMLWPLDYKTAKNIKTLHLQTDPQISAYMWAVPHLYDQEKYPIGGFYYQQHRKAIPNPPRILQNGNISTAQNQGTNYYMYRQALIEKYGHPDRAPEPNQAFLQSLLMFQDEWKDEYIQIDRIRRNDRQGQSEGAKILLELEDMLNPNLPLYPNPNFMCAHWEYPCPFLSACVSIDDGSDWQHELSQTMVEREPVYDSWRKKIIWPGDPDPAAIRQEIATGKIDSSWMDDLDS